MTEPKLIQIARGWYNFATANTTHQELAISRLQICEECPEKVELSETSAQLISSVGGNNPVTSSYRCGACGCPLSSKTLSPNSACPLGKW